jgi:hypothetical protein
VSRTNEKKLSIPTEPPVSYQIPLINLDHFSSLPEKTQRQFVENIKSGLIGDYLQAIEAVKKQKSLTTDEKLRMLLVPLVFYNTLDPFGNPIPFVDESVDIERELDLERLFYDMERYDFGLTDRGHGPEENTLLSPSSPIWIREKFESDLKIREGDAADSIFTAGMVPLEELYEEWLPSLDEEKIQSKDRLDQVLVAFTIKKAQNGNEEAILKLCGLYARAAEGLAVKFGKKHKLYKEFKNLKLDAQWFLRFIITGFRLGDIINQLVGPDPGRDIPETEKVIKLIPPWVRSFYIHYLTEYLPQRMEKNIRETQRNQALIEQLTKLLGDNRRHHSEKAIKVLKARNVFLDFHWIGSLNLYTPFQANTLWKTPKLINRFNSYSFRPGLVKMGPRWNLTTWLFGRGKEKAWIPYGKLYQLLRDKYKPTIKKVEKRKGDITTDDAEDDFNEEYTKNLTYRERKEAPLSHFWKHPDTQEVSMDGKSSFLTATQISDLMRSNQGAKYRFAKSKKKIMDALKKVGASQRDAEIFVTWKFQKMFSKHKITQVDLANQYNLSDRWIRKICRRVETLINRQ